MQPKTKAVEILEDIQNRLEDGPPRVIEAGMIADVINILTGDRLDKDGNPVKPILFTRDLP